MRSGFFNSEIIGYDVENMPIFDRAEEASFFAKYFSQFISNGVFPNPSTNMQVLATQGMTVKVDIGVCYINGYMGWVEPFEMLEIEESDTRARIDRIVARLDFTDRSIKLAIKKGIVTGTPVAPTLQRDYDIYEIGLADIKVNANVVEIKQENITDLRLNTQLCGVVTNHLQHIDTTTLFNQYQDWLNRVTGEAEEGLEEWKNKFETTLQEQKQNFETSLEEERQKFETILNNLKSLYTEDFNTWFNNLKVVLSENVAGNLQLEIENLQEDIDTKYTNINERINILESKSASHIYGVKRNINTSGSAWERIGDSVGLVANATHDGTEVQNDFDNIYPWSDIISYNYDTESQRITAFLGEPTFKFDGTNGEVMTRFPEFWYKREQKIEEDGNTYEYVYIADGKVDGFIKSEQFSLGRYPTFVDTDKQKVCSKSGVKGSTNVNVNILRNYSKALGDGFCLMDWHYFLIQLLFLVEYANYNSQHILGQGTSFSTKEIVTNGECNSLGMKSGCLIDDEYHSIIYRGIENVFGNLAQVLDGIMGRKIRYNSQEYGLDYTEGTYNELSYEVTGVRGFIKDLGYDENNPIIQMPKTVSREANSSNYITDSWSSYDSEVEEDIMIICVGIYYPGGSILTNGLWSYSFICSTKTGVGSRFLLNK